MTWRLSYCAEPAALRFARPHYSRRKNANARKLGAPAEQLVLASGAPIRALWMTTVQRPEFVKHAWPGAWLNSFFRNEGGGVASELIRAAVAVTRWRWPEVPVAGMVTFIDRAEVRPTMVRGVPTWGWTYLRAGFEPARCPQHWPAKEPKCNACLSLTEAGLLVVQMRPENMPEAMAPWTNQEGLFGRMAG